MEENEEIIALRCSLQAHVKANEVHKALLTALIHSDQKRCFCDGASPHTLECKHLGQLYSVYEKGLEDGQRE